MVENKGQMPEENDSSHQCKMLIQAKDTNKELILGSSIGDPWYTRPKQSEKWAQGKSKSQTGIKKKG